MANIRESSINVIRTVEPNKLTGSSQKARAGQSTHLLDCTDTQAHGGETMPKSVVLQQRNEVSPTARLSQDRQADRKEG